MLKQIILDEKTQHINGCKLDERIKDQEELIELAPVAKDGVQMDDQLFLLRGEGTTLEVWSEVVDPTESTALPTPLQAGIPGHIAPTPLPICYHVVHQLVILLRRPQPLPQLVAIP